MSDVGMRHLTICRVGIPHLSPTSILTVNTIHFKPHPELQVGQLGLVDVQIADQASLDMQMPRSLFDTRHSLFHSSLTLSTPSIFSESSASTPNDHEGPISPNEPVADRGMLAGPDLPPHPPHT
jgi:hypothetical protein